MESACFEIVPPQDEKALADAGFTVINATCPRVVRVQVIIDKYSKKGYDTIILGDEKHPEVIGLLGYARDKGHTVTSLDQLKALPQFEKAVVVAQTTQNTKFFREIREWVRQNHPQFKIFNTICDSTEKRQAEVRMMAGQVAAFVIIGGHNSGNTRRLFEIGRGDNFSVTDAGPKSPARLDAPPSISKPKPISI